MRVLPRAALPVLTLLLAGLLAGGCSAKATYSNPNGVGATPSPAASGSQAASTPGASFPDPGQQQVLKAASDFAVRVTSYDYQHLPQDVNDTLKLSTDPLLTRLRNSLTGDFAQQTTQGQRAAKGSLVESGLESLAGDNAVAVIFVDQQVTNPNGATTQRLRLKITMKRINGAWLASDLQIV